MRTYVLLIGNIFLIRFFSFYRTQLGLQVCYIGRKSLHATFRKWREVWLAFPFSVGCISICEMSKDIDTRLKDDLMKTAALDFDTNKDLDSLLPRSLRSLKHPQSDLPRIAKDPELIKSIENIIKGMPTSHDLHHDDACRMDFLEEQSLHLILTSPPYWTLKKYPDSDRQLGHVSVYEEFLDELDKVWQHCYRALVPGGRLICVVGDVCLSRRKNAGRHTVVPLHASIQERCRKIGFDNLAPIIWNKIANASYEVEGGSGFLGKPYEPNAVIKNDIEYILMERKPGGYRKPSVTTRVLSVISEENHKKWFQQIWTGLAGASTKKHPAPFPLELAERLIRMFSFIGDTVLDPFMGTGTTNIAASMWGRNSIGVEIEPHYFNMACKRMNTSTSGLFSEVKVQEIPKV